VSERVKGGGKGGGRVGGKGVRKEMGEEDEGLGREVKGEGNEWWEGVGRRDREGCG